MRSFASAVNILRCDLIPCNLILSFKQILDCYIYIYIYILAVWFNIINEIVLL